MVLRLGGPGPTRFALATVADVHDFFVPEPIASTTEDVSSPG
jgi:hypothetical protein